MASTPVRAVAPEEKARAIRNTLRVVVAVIGRSEVAANGQPPMQRIAPSTSVKPTITTNP